MSKTKEKGKTARLLVVEDEEGARLALVKILQTYRFEVLSAYDGETALSVFEEDGDIDAVITDLTLPGISGWDVARRVREKSPATPVIVLSGWDISKDDNNIPDSGVSLVLSKPIRVKEMVSAVEKLLGKGK